MLKCKFTCEYVLAETAFDYSKYDLILIIIQATVRFRFIVMLNNYYYYYFVIGRFV